MKVIKNWQRYVLEWGILAALIIFILVSNVIGERINPETYYGSLPCDMSSLQILSGIALIATVVLFSKLFCAYLCPLGTITTGELVCKKFDPYYACVFLRHKANPLPFHKQLKPLAVSCK